jgi:hypothetical protein
MRKTNPISHRRRRLTDEIVQNEAKLGGTGVYGQRRLPWGPRVGRGVKCAKRTQFPPAGGDRRRKSFERNPIWSRRGQICKTRRTRQKSESGESIFDSRPKTLVPARLGDFCRGRQTNPISAASGRRRAGTPDPRSGRGQALRKTEACETNPISPRRRRLIEGIVRNEAKLGGAGVCGERRFSCGARLGREMKRAKRTQFGPAGGAWRRQNAQNEPNLVRPEAKCAKRTQFAGRTPTIADWDPGSGAGMTGLRMAAPESARSGRI